jgi:hypothetical protein
MRTLIHLAKNARSHIPGVWVLVCCVLGVATAAWAQPEVDGNPDSSGFIKIPSDTDDWTRHFRLGALMGMNISAKFNESGLFNVSGNNAANGIYDNGYVREDQTGNAGGLTGYWGYDNASQYNASAQTLTMQSTTSYSTSSSGNESGIFPGVEMAYGDNIWYWKHARVGWELGFGLLPIDISENSATSGEITQSTFTYNTGGIIMPTAPYQGGPSGVGEPVIPTTYSATTNQTSGNISGTRSLDVMLYTLRLGPSFYWDLGEHVGMSLGAGPAVGLVSGNYKYNETITANGSNSQNTGQFGATDFIYGGYVTAAFMYHVQDDADIYVAAQYMPMSSANFSSGGREGELDLKGQLYLSVGINWPF